MVAWHRVGAVILRQAYLIRGSFARMFPLFAWVAIDMVLWGFITRYLNAVSGARMDFVPSLLGAVLLWDFLVRVMQGVTMAFFEDVWSRNFLNIFTTPLTVREYLAGLIASSVITSSVGLAVMLSLTTVVFNLSFFDYGLPIIPFLLILFLCGIVLGVVSCAAVLRLGPASEWFIWPLPAMVAPFAGVFYPVTTLPGWMQEVAHALPPAYVFEGIRAIVAGEAVPAGALAWAGGLAAVYLAAAVWFFTRTYRYVIRTGLLARYSAETAS